LSSTGRYVTSTGGTRLTLARGVWTLLSVTIKAASGQSYVALEPNFSSAGVGTVVTWDDMSVTAN
jgi:hypothetical protein